MISEGSSAIGYLTTVGRASGRPHRVALRLVYHRGNVYASRRDAASDWCRNLIANPGVRVEMGGSEFGATARLVEDSDLAMKISRLKYGDARSLRRRVVVEIVPDPA